MTFSPVPDGSVCGVRRAFPSLLWLSLFPGPSHVSLNVCIVLQSAGDMWRAYLGLLSPYHFQSLPIELIHHPSHLGPQPQASQAAGFLCSFSTGLAAVLTMLLSMDFSLSIPNQVCPYLLAAKLVFNFCPALVNQLPYQAGWWDGSCPGQEGCRLLLFLHKVPANSLEMNISQFVICISLIYRDLKWFDFDNFFDFFLVFGERIFAYLFILS